MLWISSQRPQLRGRWKTGVYVRYMIEGETACGLALITERKVGKAIASIMSIDSSQFEHVRVNSFRLRTEGA